MKFFVTMPAGEIRNTFFTPKSIAKLQSLGQLSFNPYDRNLTADEVVEMAADVDVLLTGWGTICYNKELLKRFPNLKLLAYTAGSVAPLAELDVYETDVAVIGGNNVFAKSVAEGTLAYILHSLRQIEHYSNLIRNGSWRPSVFQNRGLIGKKVGVVGFGTISKFFLELIRWFNCEVLIYSSHLSAETAAAYGGRIATLEEIFSECDVVSIHTSMTEKTAGMINRELLERLKPDALFVNTSRGGVVDEKALFELLLEGRFYAALDVYVEEPLKPENPIRQCSNAFLMPHMGGPTIDMREEVVMELCRDIQRLQNGEEMHNRFDMASAARMTK